MPKVSVIIPIYDVDAYLRDCLDSAVNQTLQDIEIICIDDGSPDNSAAIVVEFMQRHSNIKLIRKENGGASSARNAGLDVATGEYIHFLDGDDALELHALESLYRTASDRQLDILLFNMQNRFYTPELARQRQSLIEYYAREADYSGLCTGQMMFARLFRDRKFYGSSCISLYRREFLEAHRLRFYPGILYEDLPFFFQALMLAQRADYVPDRFYIRIVREKSVTTSRKTLRHAEGYATGYCNTLIFLQNIPLQEDVAPLIPDFLDKEFCCYIYNIWKSLPEEERQKPLSTDNICAAHLLKRVKQDYETEMRLRNRIDVVTAQRDRLKQQVLQLKQPAQPGMLRRLPRALRNHGLGGTLRLLWKKLRDR